VASGGKDAANADTYRIATSGVNDWPTMPRKPLTEMINSDMRNRVVMRNSLKCDASDVQSCH
jgi:hypothetical protein